MNDATINLRVFLALGSLSSSFFRYHVRMPRLRREILINVLVLLGTLILLLLFLEWFLRFSGIQRLGSRNPHLHQSSSIEGVNYEFIPNLKNVRGYNWEHVSTNSLGFRGPELDSKKPSLALIGDSFVFGFGLSDNQSQDAYLRSAFPDHNILNTGVDGYNIEQEVRAYQGKFPTLQPDLAIVEFVWNDMKPASILTDEQNAQVAEPEGYYEKPAVADAKLNQAITQTGTLKIPFKLWLTKHSAIFNFVEQRTKWLPFRSHATDILTDPITKQDLAFYETWLDKLAKGLPNSKKIFVIWPEHRLHLESRAALRAMAEQRGFLVLDLYDLFGMDYPHLSWDWHPNVDAQKKAADLLIDISKHYSLLIKS